MPFPKREEGNCCDLAQALAPPAQVGPPLPCAACFPRGQWRGRPVDWPVPAPWVRGEPCPPGSLPALPQFRENVQDVLAVLPSTDDYFLLRWPEVSMDGNTDEGQGHMRSL